MKRTLFVFLTLVVCVVGHALTLPSAIDGYMVLQQQSEARIWGWAAAGQNVTVATSWDGRTYKARAGSDGRWDVMVNTPAASFDLHTVTIATPDSSVTLRDVLVGEVWFASGQSNMEMPLNGFWTQPIEGSNRAIAHAREYYNKVRMLTVPKTSALTPQQRVEGRWKQATPAEAQWMSAVGWWFATELCDILGVPVGIINCSWGGSKVEGWLPAEVLSHMGEDPEAAANPNVTEYYRPMIMYNGMLRPLAGYTVRGFLWNQGESNVGQHEVYAQRLATMVGLWRYLWQNPTASADVVARLPLNDLEGSRSTLARSPESVGDGTAVGTLRLLPFYMVEIPPHDYGDARAVNASQLRDAQHAAVRIIPASGIVSTADLSKPYEAPDIHPSQKQPIGERLAWMAAARTYGVEGIWCDAPTYRDMKIEGNKVTLYFDSAPEGFTPNRDIEGFEVAGTDRVFHPATAQTVYPDGRPTLQVSSPDVAEPVAVRFGYHNWAPVRVWNHRQLPLVPFRTDNW